MCLNLIISATVAVLRFSLLSFSFAATSECLQSSAAADLGMVRPVCFRQGKNLSKNLREALRSFPWGTHHIADVADLKFCLLVRSFLMSEAQAKPLQQRALHW
jgi:hypothetical protein